MIVEKCQDLSKQEEKPSKNFPPHSQRQKLFFLCKNRASRLLLYLVLDFSSFVEMRREKKWPAFEHPTTYGILFQQIEIGIHFDN